MRTALLSAIRRTDTGDLRAGLMLAGRSVLAWQADWARALGCDRVICLSETPGEAVLNLQSEIESGGGECLVVKGNLQLAGIVRAEDELVVLMDGLVPDRSISDHWQKPGDKLHHAIATLPADHALASEHPEDFERLDRERRWGGIAVVKAAQVHKLADMPPDGDAVSMLLRLALQAQVGCKELPRDAFDTGEAVFALAPDQLARRELSLVEAGSAIPPWSGPGRALASLIVRKVAPKRLANGVEAGIAVGALSLAGGLALSVWGNAVAALGLAAVGAFSIAVAGAWSGLRARLWSIPRNRLWDLLASPAIDLVVLGILLFSRYFEEGPDAEPSIGLVSMPVIAIGLTHLLGREPDGAASAWGRDRTTHCAFFAICAAAGYLSEGISIFALMALGILALSRKQK